MAPGTPGAVFKTREPFFGKAWVPFIEFLYRYPQISTHLTYITYFLVSFEPCQPLPSSSLYDILVHVGDLLCVGLGPSLSHILPECHLSCVVETPLHLLSYTSTVSHVY